MPQRIVVTVIGKDRVGIVARVAGILAEHRVNIQDINQKILGEDIFSMTLLADMELSSTPLADLARALEQVGEEMGLKVMT